MEDHHQIIISGFGGQGILSAGKMLAYGGMIEDKYVSWVPSYGPEMRGGTANCHVIVSKELIASPILSKVTALIVMNEPSLEKFESYVNQNGLIILDNSIINKFSVRKDIDVVAIPATQLANEMGNVAFANIILLGKLIHKTNLISKETIIESFKSILPEKKHHLIPMEINALELGMKF
ncbi:MAG: 2-oxoacid:acceptor oxidoreductase family protein [Clostridiales bacterium]